MDITRLDPAAYRRTPWKNGGGITIDIADSYATGAVPGGWSGMLWRLGRTRIIEPGPFSDLSGYDRILTVIGGRGLVLEIAGGPALDVREPFRPVRFAGEDRITSRLEAGPVAVLNLMADRRHAIDVTIMSGNDTRRLDAAINIVYAIEDSEIAVGGQTFSLTADEAVRSDQGGTLTMRSGRVALSTISSRSVP
jgi:environmental stress-induced protein Ves